MNRKILLIEDDPRLCSFVYKGLTEEAYTVEIATTGEMGLNLFHSSHPDLIILDIMLPAKSGIEVCEEIRMTNQRIPILFLTALGTSENIVKGLSSGADDYLVKPFKFIELVARIKTLLRRITDFTIEEEEKDSYTFQDIELDDESKIVTRAGQPILLTSTEFRLLSLFLRSPNKVFSRTEILEDVWGINFDLGTNVVDVYVNYLRKKLEKGGKSRVIQTKIGMGYVLK